MGILRQSFWMSRHVIEYRGYFEDEISPVWGRSTWVKKKFDLLQKGNISLSIKRLNRKIWRSASKKKESIMFNLLLFFWCHFRGRSRRRFLADISADLDLEVREALLNPVTASRAWQQPRLERYPLWLWTVHSVTSLVDSLTAQWPRTIDSLTSRLSCTLLCLVSFIQLIIQWPCLLELE